MKDLLLFFFVFGLCLTFTIDQSQGKIQFYTLSLTGTCSDQRVKVVNSSLNFCQTVSYSQAASCIKTILQSNLPNQKWNVISQSNSSDAQFSYWFYNDCQFKYQMNKTVRQKLTIWKASPSPSQLSDKQDKELTTLEDEDCTAERLNAAFYAITYCQNNNSSLQVTCIKNNIMTRIGQKWDSLVWTESGFSYKYDYYNGCNLKLNSFGHNSRNYLVWKAQ